MMEEVSMKLQRERNFDQADEGRRVGTTSFCIWMGVFNIH